MAVQEQLENKSQITLSERAAKELKDLLEEQQKPEASLRVWVAGGGCSGLQYGMALDDEKAEAEDVQLSDQGINILVDKLSIKYMQGSVIDFVDDQFGGGFKIENPNAVTSCGCGSSFSTEDEGMEGLDTGGRGGCGGCGSRR